MSDWLWPAIIIGGFVLLVWVAFVAIRGVSIKPPEESSTPRPAGDREEAMARLAKLQAEDADEVADACRTRLIEPSAPARATLVLWHGFSNCPAQFAEVAELIAEGGVRVLLPRVPQHGKKDVLTRDLLELTTGQLIEHVDTCIDIAAGFGQPVWTAGLSAGGVLASWAAVTRHEVTRVAAASPFVAPKGMPLPVVRLFVRYPWLLPNIYFWWDPRKKENLGESPYVYPGFPLPSMVPVLHLAETMFDDHIEPNHRLRRAVLISNPGDFAIRRDAAQKFADSTFRDAADFYAEINLDADLGWWHDFIDRYGPHHGPAEQVAEVFLSALGIATDATAAGAIVAPVPDGDDGGDLAAVMA